MVKLKVPGHTNHEILPIVFLILAIVDFFSSTTAACMHSPSLDVLLVEGLPKCGSLSMDSSVKFKVSIQKALWDSFIELLPRRINKIEFKQFTTFTKLKYLPVNHFL